MTITKVMKLIFVPIIASTSLNLYADVAIDDYENFQKAATLFNEEGSLPATEKLTGTWDSLKITGDYKHFLPIGSTVWSLESSPSTTLREDDVIFSKHGPFFTIDHLAKIFIMDATAREYRFEDNVMYVAIRQLNDGSLIAEQGVRIQNWYKAQETPPSWGSSSHLTGIVSPCEIHVWVTAASVTRLGSGTYSTRLVKSAAFSDSCVTAYWILTPSK